MATFFDEIRRNKIRSDIIIFFFILFVLFIGGFIGFYYSNGAKDGWVGGIIISLLVALIYFLIVWSSGSKIVLSATGAKEVDVKTEPRLVNIVDGLAIAAGIPSPKVYVIKDSALNAFATGRDPKHASIAVTTGLLKRMTKEELEGVIAHEMSHIKNYDIRVMMLTSVLVGVLTFIGDFMVRSFLWGGGRRNNDGAGEGQLLFIAIGLILVIISPLIGQIIRLAVSRKREFLADASGAMLTRYPQGLANALKKIKNDPDPLVDKANRATAHLFISTPFRKKTGIFTRMFSTHPPIEERIRRLENM